MEDTTQSNRDQTAKMNASKAPQKVEVVVANPSSNQEVNILGELSIFILRLGFSILMIIFWRLILFVMLQKKDKMLCSL